MVVCKSSFTSAKIRPPSRKERERRVEREKNKEKERRKRKRKKTRERGSKREKLKHLIKARSSVYSSSLFLLDELELEAL